MRLSLAFSSCYWRSWARCETVMPENWFFHLVRQLADAVLPERLADLGSQFDLLEDADYLRFAEFGFLHVETPLGWILYFRVAQVFKGTSPRLNLPRSPQSASLYVSVAQVVASTRTQQVLQSCIRKRNTDDRGCLLLCESASAHSSLITWLCESRSRLRRHRDEVAHRIRSSSSRATLLNVV